METEARHKLPVQGILISIAGCPNEHLITRLLELVIQDCRYDQDEWETIQRYATARLQWMRGRL